VTESDAGGPYPSASDPVTHLAGGRDKVVKW
jgi:hypothetical protein